MNTTGLYIVLILIVALTISSLFNQKKSKYKLIYDIGTEAFNDQVGQFCTTCAGKTFNQCSRCFNCGFCVDKLGNASCIGGDHKAPYNFERCAQWYHTDPYAFMLQRNANYRCGYGPKSSNRLIGI